MLKLFLFIARFSITAWLGAAILFVVLTVMEILSGQFDSIVLDSLVLLRFPIYYAFTFTLLAISLAAGIACWFGSKGKICKLFTVLVAVSLLILTGDYFWVYRPLEAMLTPLGVPRSPDFPFYHKLTEALNSVAMLINLIAACRINWPGKLEKDNACLPSN